MEGQSAQPPTKLSSHGMSKKNLLSHHGTNRRSIKVAATFWCEGFPEPEAGDWPVRWTLSRPPDVTFEAERLLEDDNHGDEAHDDWTLVHRRWADAYTTALALVRAKRTWRRTKPEA